MFVSNEAAPENIPLKFVTELTSQLPMAPVKFAASLKALLMLVTELTVHLLRLVPSKADAPSNMLSM
jgi:hypothetical protein